MKKVLITVACLGAWAGVPARAQQGIGSEVVTVKVKDGSHRPLQLIISRDSGPAEVLTFEAKGMRKPGAKEAATQQVFAKLYREGFVVKNSFGGGATNSATSTRSSSSAKSSAPSAPLHTGAETFT